jgi:NitT/TauT family transport system substrate-binding protein
MGLARYAGIGTAMCAAVALVSGAAYAQDDRPVVRIQGVGGSISSLPLLILEHEKLDEKHGFKAEIDLMGMSGGFQSFLVGNFEVSLDEDMIGVAAARLQGFDATVFYANAGIYTGIIVPGGSEAATPEDLVGKRVGHFGMDSGTTTYIRLILQDLYGIDVATDYDLQQVGPAALVPLLGSGEVEAIFNFEPLLSAAIVETDGRVLMHSLDAYRDYYEGFSPWFATFAAREEWLMENQELALAVRDALREATLKIIESDYEILREPYLSSSIGVQDEAVLNLIIEHGRSYHYFTDDYTTENVRKAHGFLERLAREGGPIEEVPENVAVVLEDYFAQ